MTEVWVVDGEDAGEGCGGGSGGGGEEGGEIVDEASAGVVVEGESSVEAFLCFGAALEGEIAGCHEEEVYFFLFRFYFFAYFVDVS